MLVVGGGATGLGVAVDAASRGYRTLLLEMADFAQGTSSRSTKLIHGGLRYLRQAQFKLVRDSLRERTLLLRNAPHLVRELDFVLPVANCLEAAWYRLGLQAYDLLAGEFRLAPSRSLPLAELDAHQPGLARQGLGGALLYRDAQFDDARLAIALYRTLEDLGGVALNHAHAVAFTKKGGRISGVAALDLENSRDFEVQARVVVNATGVFCDSLRWRDDSRAEELLSPSQGAHLVLPGDFLPGPDAIIVPKTDDGRVFFAIPWHGRTLLGTTDQPVSEVLLEPYPLAEEVAFILEHARRYLARAPQESDVLAVFAGLRPLLRPRGKRDATASLSREHCLEVSASGLVTVTGGKWTTYREMAQATLDRAVLVGGLDPKPCRTATLRLHGAPEPGQPPPPGPYGTDADAVAALAKDQPELAQPFDPRLPLTPAQVLYAIRFEMARRADDVLARRSRCLILDARATGEIATKVIALMAKELQRDLAWERNEACTMQSLVANSLWRGEERAASAAPGSDL